MEQDGAVFILVTDRKCNGCGEDLPRRSWVTPKGDKWLCTECSGLDVLEFLPAGDAAMTRRAKKHSIECYVVLKFSKARKRYERQGLLVDADAIALAEAQCAADAPKREARAERDAEKRDQADLEYKRVFADSIRNLYPAAPEGVEHEIATRACQKYSGRVGRSDAARRLDPHAIDLAVRAHIRHNETDYDRILAQTDDRSLARIEVRSKVDAVASAWSTE